jgi:hypothetical protein
VGDRHTEGTTMGGGTSAPARPARPVMRRRSGTAGWNAGPRACFRPGAPAAIPAYAAAPAWHQATKHARQPPEASW